MLLTDVVVAGALACFLAVPARALGARFGLTGRTRLPSTGGLALAGAWWVTALALLPPSPATAGLALALLPIVIVGLVDLRRPLGPWPQAAAQVLAAASVVVVGGVAARFVTNPFGGLIRLDAWSVGTLPLLGALLSLAWIVLLMNAVNFLDGMDGLAASVSAVGFSAIGAVSLLPHVQEPAVATWSFLAAGATLGFLFWNFPPAKIYLGTPGVWFLGLLLGTLSLLGSSKIATLAVVGAIPLLDALSVILARIRRGASPFRGDTTHLHHRLRASGWPPHSVLLLYAGLSAALGFAAAVLPTVAKVLTFLVCGSAVVLWTVLRPTPAGR